MSKQSEKFNQPDKFISLDFNPFNNDRDKQSGVGLQHEYLSAEGFLGIIEETVSNNVLTRNEIRRRGSRKPGSIMPAEHESWEELDEIARRTFKYVGTVVFPHDDGATVDGKFIPAWSSDYFKENTNVADDKKHAFVGDGDKCGKDGCPDAKGASSHFTGFEGVAKALGFKDGETPTGAELVAVIDGIKTEKVGKFSEGDEAIRKELVSLRRDNLVQRYGAEAEKLNLIEGTTEELTTKFVEHYERFGEDEANALLDNYKAVQVAAETTGVPANILKDKAPAASDFMEAVNKYAAENPDKTKSEAMDIVKVVSPALFTEYQAERTARNGFGKTAVS